MEVQVRITLLSGDKVTFRRVAESATKEQILAAFRALFGLTSDSIVKFEKIVVMEESDDWDSVVKPIVNIVGTQQVLKGVYGGLFKTLYNGRNISRGTSAAEVVGQSNVKLKQISKGGYGGKWEVTKNG